MLVRTILEGDDAQEHVVPPQIPLCHLSGESDFNALNTGCAAGVYKGCSGSIWRSRTRPEEVRSGANQSLGQATHLVARELQKLLVRAQSDRHQHEHGRRGHEVLERHNEGNVVGISDAVLWKKFCGGFDGGRVESGAKVVTILPARTGVRKTSRDDPEKMSRGCARRCVDHVFF